MLGVAAGLALAASMLLCARRAIDAGASDAATAICIALLCIDVEGSFGIRAQVFAWPAFCALLWMLDRRGRAIFWSFPLVAVWANVHASAMIAIPIVWIDAIAAVLREGWCAETRRRIALALAVPFATLATPLGVRLPAYAVALLNSPIRHSIKEWQPIAWHHDFFWYGGMPLLALAVLGARTLARERPRDLAWAAMLAAAAASAVRNVSLLGFTLVPLSARALDLVLARVSWWPPAPLRTPGTRRFAFWTTAIAAAAVAAATLREAPARGTFVPPVYTFEQISALPGEHRVFCYDFAICSIGLDYPNVRVFLDGRADPYPVSVWNDFNLVREARPGWQARLDAYDVDVTIVKRYDALDRAMARDARWRPLPTLDACCRAYARRKRR